MTEKELDLMIEENDGELNFDDGYALTDYSGGRYCMYAPGEEFGEGTICSFKEAVKFYNDHKGECNMLNINTQFFGRGGSGGGKRSGGGSSKNALSIEKKFSEFQDLKMNTWTDGSKHGKKDTGELLGDVYNNTMPVKNFKSDDDNLKATIKSKSGDIEVSVKNGTLAHREFSRYEDTRTRSAEVTSDYRVTGSDGRSYIVRTNISQTRYEGKTRTYNEYIVSMRRVKKR